MAAPGEPLLDEGGLRITPTGVSAPGGEYPLADIGQVETRVRKPLWGPVLLALIGSLNLALALESGFWLDFAAAALMLGGGIAWRVFGTRYVLTLTLPRGRTDVWFSRRESELERARAIVARLLAQRDA